MRTGGEGSTKDNMVDDIIGTMGMSLSKLWEMVKDREAWQTAAAAMGSSRVGNK